jgi:uncharacterized membrane protein
MSTTAADERRPSIAVSRCVLATVATLLVAFVLETVLFHGGHHSLSDIPGRFAAWHVRPTSLPYEWKPIEYPVVIGYLSWLLSWVGRGPWGFFVANAALTAGLAVVLTFLLEARGGARVYRWAAGIPLALYAFHNWDVVALVPAIAALLAFERRRDATSGALLAIGTLAKVFPCLLLPPLVWVRWHNGDRRGAGRLVGAFAITAVVLNAPIALTNWHAWTYPATFQGGRRATWGSLSFWLQRAPGVHPLLGPHLQPLATAVAIVVLVGAMVGISYLAARHHLTPIEIGAAVVGVFLLTNQVYSPNYDLWLVPFFVLLPISRRSWIAFSACALGIFVAVFGYLHGHWSGLAAERFLLPLVLVRAAVIVGVIYTALTGRYRMTSTSTNFSAPPLTVTSSTSPVPRA